MRLLDAPGGGRATGGPGCRSWRCNELSTAASKGTRSGLQRLVRIRGELMQTSLQPVWYLDRTVLLQMLLHHLQVCRALAVWSIAFCSQPGSPPGAVADCDAAPHPMVPAAVGLSAPLVRLMVPALMRAGQAGLPRSLQAVRTDLGQGGGGARQPVELLSALLCAGRCQVIAVGGDAATHCYRSSAWRS